MKQKRKDGLIFFHMSGQIAMPVYSFCDAMVDGENFTARLDRKENRGYERVLSLDAFAAQYNTQNNLGPVSVFLPEFERSGSIRRDEWSAVGTQPADYILGLILLHDSQLWWAYIHSEQTIKVYSALDRAGWGKQYEFVPYWSQRAAKLPNGVVATFYRDRERKRALAVVMNLNEQPVALNAAIDMDELGLPMAAAASDLVHDGNPRMVNARLQVSVPAKSFRMLLLR